MLLAVLIIGTAGSSQAAIYTYSATADSNWSITTNWTPNGTPNGIGDVVQKTQSTTRTVIQDITGGVTVGTLTTSNGSFIVQTSNQITLNNGGAGATISNTATAGTSALMTVGTNSTTMAPISFGLTLADNLSIMNTFAGNTNSSGSIKVNAAIGGNGNITISNVLNSATAGQIRIEGANTFNGTVGITKGAVTFTANTAFGGPTNNTNANTITLGSTNLGGVTLVSSAALGSSFAGSGAVYNNIVVSGNTGGTILIGTLSAAASGVTNFAGSTTLNGDLSLTSAQTTLGTGTFLSGLVSGTGKLTIAGTGFSGLVSANVNTFTGDTVVNSGASLVLGGGNGPTSTASATSVLAGSTLDTSGGGGIVFGAGTSTMLTSVTLGGLKGTGNLTLTNANTAGTGAAVAAPVTLLVGNNNTNTTYSGALGAGGSITKIGTGQLTFSGANSYTGTTTVSAGALIAGTDAPAAANGAFGNTSNSIKLGDANTLANNSSPSLLTGGAFTIGRAVTVQNQATTGTYTIGGNTDNASAFTGAILINQNLTVSQVATTGNNALGISGGITSAGGNQMITFAGPGAINVGTAAIGNGSGTLAVNVTGGTTTFSSANSYTGATTVNGGTLSLDNNNTATPRLAGTGTVTVNGGGALLLTQSGATASTDRIGNATGVTLAGGVLNLNGKSEIATGTLSSTSNGVGALTLSVTSTLDFGTGNNGNVIQFGGINHTPGVGTLAVINWDGTADTGGDSERLLFSGLASSFTSQFAQGDVSFNGVGGYSAIQFGNAAGDATSYYEIAAVAVPEPATVLGAMALVVVAGVRERKRGLRLARALLRHRAR